MVIYETEREVMTFQEALKMLESFDIPPKDDWDRHCKMVSDIAYKIALELESHCDIDAERVRVMGLVHDFGRIVTNDPYAHAYEGYKLMKEAGHPDLARICVCHSNGTYLPEDLGAYGLKPEDFYCKTLEEKLVFIADNLDYRGKITRNDLRIMQTVERYKNTNPEFVPVLLSKLDEFESFNSEIKNLCGKDVYEILDI